MNTTSNALKAKNAIYWMTTGIAAAAFLISGIGNLIRLPHIALDMAHLGYPDYFMSILGTWKVLGAIVILSPRLPRVKEWAYAGMLFDLTGAALSRASTGDHFITIALPLIIGGIVITSWWFRPENRTEENIKYQTGVAKTPCLIKIHLLLKNLSIFRYAYKVCGYCIVVSFCFQLW